MDNIRKTNSNVYVSIEIKHAESQHDDTHFQIYSREQFAREIEDGLGRCLPTRREYYSTHPDWDGCVIEVYDNMLGLWINVRHNDLRNAMEVIFPILPYRVHFKVAILSHKEDYKNVL